MARIKITSGVFGEDKTTWEAGTVHECSEQFALQMVAENRGYLMPEEVPASPDALEQRDPALTTASAPPLTKRGRR